MNDEETNEFGGFSPLPQQKKLSSQKVEQPSLPLHDFNLGKVYRSNSKMSLSPAISKRSLLQIGGSQKSLISRTNKGMKMLQKNVPARRPIKRLVYTNHHGMKDYFDIDKEEYERLKLQTGVDFDNDVTQNTKKASFNVNNKSNTISGAIDITDKNMQVENNEQNVINLFVKTLLQGLPIGWTRENDIDDNIVYYNKQTKITTYQHPLSKLLRKNIQKYYKNIIKDKEWIQDMESKDQILIPEASVRQLDFQKRIAEKRRQSIIYKLKQSNTANQTSQKIIIGSSTSIKIMKKLEQGQKPKDLIESLTYKDTKSELRLRYLYGVTRDQQTKVFETFYKNAETQELNKIMVEAFTHYQKKFLKILTSPVNQYYYQRSKNSSELALPDSSVDQADVENKDLVPELPPYITRNDYFKTITMEQQIELAIYYGINPATEYYLLWIPRLALSMKLFNRWIKGFSLDKMEEQNDHLPKQSKHHKYTTEQSEDHNKLPQNRVYYKHVVSQIVTDFHPADPFIRYMIQIYQKSLKVNSQTHFKNFEMKGEDNLNRVYEQKTIFCEILGIENIIKHSIYVKLQQFQQNQQKQKPQNIQWSTNFPKNLSQNKALTGQGFNEEQDQYDNFTDAEIFALATQCDLNLESDLHLLSYLVMIAAQVKAQFSVDLEFRYIKETHYQPRMQGNIGQKAQSSRGQRQNQRNLYQQQQQIGLQNQPICYWRDVTNEKNHRVFPLLNEVKQRLDVLKSNLQVYLEGPRFKSYLKDLDRFKAIFKGNPEAFHNQIMKQKHLLIEQYLTTLLEKGRIDPAVFKLEKSTKTGKNYFHVSQEDINRIFHLLGNKVKYQEIIDFCFQSPFKFELSEAEYEHHRKMLRELESEERKWRIIRPPNHQFEETSEIDYDDASISSRRQGRRLGRGLSFTSVINLDREDSVGKRVQQVLQNQNQQLNTQETLQEEDDSADDEMIKKLMNRKPQDSDVDLDELNSKYQNPKKALVIDTSKEEIKEQMPQEESTPVVEKQTKKQSRFSSEKKAQRELKIGKQAHNQVMVKVESEEMRSRRQQLALHAKGGLRGAMLKQKQIEPDNKTIKQQKAKEKKGYLTSGGQGKNSAEKQLNDPNYDVLNNEDFASMFSNKKQKRKALEHETPNREKGQGRYNYDDFDDIGNDYKSPSKPTRTAKDVQELFNISDEKSLVKKLKEVLQDINNLTKGITNLIKEPTGSNPLVNKLADIIYSTNMDPEEFVKNIQNLEENGDEELLKNLMASIQNIHEKKQAKRDETIEEAKQMAESYFNMLITSRKKSSTTLKLNIESPNSSPRNALYDNKQKDKFLEVSKKLNIYDRLVKALFQMARDKVQQFDPENIRRMAEASMSEEKRRSSVLFSNFVYIKNQKYIQPSDNQLGEQFKMLEQFQGHFLSLSEDLGIEEPRMTQKGTYLLFRQNDLLTDSQQTRRETMMLEYYRKKYKDLPEEQLRLKLLKSDDAKSWHEDSLTDTVSQKSHSSQNREINTDHFMNNQSTDTLSVDYNLQQFRQSMRRQSLNDDVRQIDEDENEDQNISQGNIKFSKGGRRRGSVGSRRGIQGVINKSKIDGNLNGNEIQINIETFRKIAKFKQSDIKDVNSGQCGWKIDQKQEQLHHEQKQQSNKFLSIQTPNSSAQNTQQQEPSYQQKNKQNSIKIDKKQNDPETNLNQILESNIQKRIFLQYYTQIFGDPLVSDPFLIKTEQFFKPQHLNQHIQPKHLIKISKLFGISLKPHSTNLIQSDQPLCFPETDLLWIPYLLLLVDIPTHFQCLQLQQKAKLKLDLILKLLKSDNFDLLCKLGDLLTYHPAFDHLTLLLRSVRIIRKERLKNLDCDKDKFQFIQDCSWLVFKEQLIHQKQSNPKIQLQHQNQSNQQQYSLYFYNFKSQQKQYMMPSNLMKSVEEYQNQLVPFQNYQSTQNLMQSTIETSLNLNLTQNSTRNVISYNQTNETRNSTQIQINEQVELERLQDSLITVLKRKISKNPQDFKFTDLDSTKDTLKQQQVILVPQNLKNRLFNSTQYSNKAQNKINIQNSIQLENYQSNQNQHENLKASYKGLRIAKKQLTQIFSPKNTNIGNHQNDQMRLDTPLIDTMRFQSLNLINSTRNKQKSQFKMKRRSLNDQTQEEQLQQQDIQSLQSEIVLQGFGSKFNESKSSSQFKFRGLLTTRHNDLQKRNNQSKAFKFPELKVQLQSQNKQNDQQDKQSQTNIDNTFPYQSYLNSVFKPEGEKKKSIYPASQRQSPIKVIQDLKQSHSTSSQNLVIHPFSPPDPLLRSIYRSSSTNNIDLKSSVARRQLNQHHIMQSDVNKQQKQAFGDYKTSLSSPILSNKCQDQNTSNYIDYKIKVGTFS